MTEKVCDVTFFHFYSLDLKSKNDSVPVFLLCAAYGVRMPYHSLHRLLEECNSNLTYTVTSMK